MASAAPVINPSCAKLDADVSWAKLDVGAAGAAPGGALNGMFAE
jgi:hypothetical protein